MPFIMPSPSRATSKTVLLVDDELSVRSTLERFLARNGFLVRTASNVDEALHLVNRGCFDAAVLDVRMPDPGCRSGLDVLDFIRLRDDLMSLPVLMLTGYFLTEDEQASIRHQRAHLCYKPTGYAALVRLLDRLIRTSEASPSGPPESGDEHRTRRKRRGK